jgi:hypothetical protein
MARDEIVWSKTRKEIALLITWLEIVYSKTWPKIGRSNKNIFGDGLVKYMVGDEIVRSKIWPKMRLVGQLIGDISEDSYKVVTA